MFGLFKFKLPKAVTEQLILELEQLNATPLTRSDLERLAEFQELHDTQSGVYVLYMGQKAVYAGKADELVKRLHQHLEKIRGRLVLDKAEIRYKALILDENWSTSANEGLLIKHYKQKGECEWNKAGFGPKDPGKNRDGYKPNKFDTNYPINLEWKIEELADLCTLGNALVILKEQLPYTVRYELEKADLNRAMNFNGVTRSAIALSSHIAMTLGGDYQFMIFKSHLVLYRSKKEYAHGARIAPE